MILKSEHLDAIAREIANQPDEVEEICVEIAGEELYVSFQKETSSFCEDDYFNGTGAYDTSCTYINISDIQSESSSIQYDWRRLEQMVENYINY